MKEEPPIPFSFKLELECKSNTNRNGGVGTCPNYFFRFIFNTILHSKHNSNRIQIGIKE